MLTLLNTVLLVVLVVLQIVRPNKIEVVYRDTKN